MIDKPASRSVRDDGFIFYNGAWHSPRSFQNIMRIMREKGERRNRRAAELRAKWIADNGPCKRCGTWDELEIDHIDPRTKERKPNQLFALSAENIAKELAKCQVLCHLCHCKKTHEDIKAGLSPKDVFERKYSAYEPAE